jgi:hypothetical protein
MQQKYDTQTLFILREFKKALDTGAHIYAARIVEANPQIPLSHFMDAEKGLIE